MFSRRRIDHAKAIVISSQGEVLLISGELSYCVAARLLTGAGVRKFVQRLGARGAS